MKLYILFSTLLKHFLSNGIFNLHLQITQSRPEDVFVLSTEIPYASKYLCVQYCIAEFFKEEVIEKYGFF